MEIMELIDSLEDAIDKGGKLPFAGKCLLDKEELLEIIAEIRLKLPDDLKQAKWVKEERQRIIVEAQKEANQIIKGAEDKIVSLINEHEITKKAQDKATEIMTHAQKRSREIRDGTRAYADEVLGDVEKAIEGTLKTLRENRNTLHAKTDRRDTAANNHSNAQEE